MATTQPTYDLDACIGFQYPDIPIEWTTRDLLVYALGIGAHNDDYNLIWEKHPQFTPFPTYGVTLPFKGNSEEVIDFATFIANSGSVPGLPKFPAAKVIQGSQFVEVLKPIPTTATGWKITKKVTGMHEAAPRGVTIDNELVLSDQNGTAYTRMMTQVVNLGGVANGTAYSKSTADMIVASDPNVPTSRDPDFTVLEPTSIVQSAIYRLCGDYNPLHIEPTLGKAIGYGGVILHGAVPYGFTARALINTFSPTKDPACFVAMIGNFISGVVPGDTLKIRMWKVGPVADKPDLTEVMYITTAVNSGVTSLTGLAHLRL